jgi:hypothetical protein
MHTQTSPPLPRGTVTQVITLKEGSTASPLKAVIQAESGYAPTSASGPPLPSLTRHPVRSIGNEAETARSYRHDNQFRSVTKFVTKPQGHAAELSRNPETTASPVRLVTGHIGGMDGTM